MHITMPLFSTMMSLSFHKPRTLFKKDGDRLTTRPMKGTTNRGLTSESDLKQAQWLAQDQKNRSENMMIVDLLRNDMNRISKIGSEDVKSLCQVEQYSTVWQMTSTIETQLLPNSSLSDVFQALFPCGSITGAPKIATMEIIKKVEKQLEVFIVELLVSWCHRDLVFLTWPFGHYKWKEPRLSMVSEEVLPGIATGKLNMKKPSKKLLFYTVRTPNSISFQLVVSIKENCYFLRSI